ncbi:MAG TPA: sigma 54-interacting transcriptional regulator, partial [Gaiellaceae bacterium]|nr:sigma 54-interacting transcriptional regulator [Gaiellaceae bacterium]
TVSRRHVTLEVCPQGVTVTDLGSRNGTFYLGHRVEKMTLALGASIQVGAATLTFAADTTSLSGMTLAEESFRGMWGVSFAMRRVFAMLARLEGSLVPVMILGESGVGKELIARAIHEGSRPKDAPLVAVNCAAIPRELMASELFGHKRGAFTGATDARQGAFEAAHGGTLFLDEIGEMPLAMQPVLLRALETGQIQPVGEDRPRRVEVRFVAATNRDLAKEVAAGRFREDLYFRLAVVKIDVPPLRDRLEDVEILARAFARRAGAVDLPDEVIAALRGHDWPGNVRELQNAVLAYLALGELPETTPNRSLLESALADLVDLTRPYSAQKDEIAERFTKVYLQALLLETGYNQSVAARVAGLDRTHLGRMLARHGLSRG